MSDAELTPFVDGATDGAGHEVARREPSSTDPGGAVLDGELVSEEEYRTVQRRKAIERYRGYRRDVVVAATVARTVVTHDRTKTTVKFVARNSIYVAQGALVLARRVWEAKTNSRYERQMRSAEAAGSQELLQEWETRAEQARQRRHERRMDWLQAPWDLAKAIGIFGITVFAVLLVLGVLLALASSDPARILGPIEAVLDVIEWTAWAFAIVWGPFLLVAPWVGLLMLWHIGRTKANTPTWVAPAATEQASGGRDVVPDESAILAALRNLGLSTLNQKVKEGWQPRWVQMPHLDGKGWRAQLELPLGVPVEKIVDRKDVLAHNLVRLPVEVWPTEPKKQPGVLDLWVAHPGALSGPVDPWPLLTEGSCDYFRSVPVGVDIRGTVINSRLFEANFGVAGTMGSGKSTLIIALLLGAVLDPLVEADVFVFAENADYDPMRPRLRSLTTGIEPDKIEACLHLLRELFSELAIRGKALQEHGERKVTRALAEKDARLRPRILVIDECQNLFLSEYGEEAAGLAFQLVTTARKYAITLVFATPEPSSDSLPRKIVAVLSNKACFAIGDWTANDAILGTGSHKAGITAVSLEPKTDESTGDVGTAMCRGFQPRPGLLRFFYIRKEGAVDEVTPVVERALALREEAGVTPAMLEPADQQPARDPLADIATVLGKAPRMRSQEVLQRLAELDRVTYGGWTFSDLTGYLSEFGAEPRKVGGVMFVRAALVHAAIAERDESGVDDPEEDWGGE